jgi:arginyl-tRNA synthetase
MNLEKLLTEKVKFAIQTLYGVEANDNLVQFQKTRKDFEGDITLVTFPLLKTSKKSPEQTGEEIGQFLKENVADVSDFNIVKGFVNLVVSNSFWVSKLNYSVETKSFGFNLGTADTLMVEYSSPNTNKPLHLGHLRNNFLGYSVAEILKANGNDVVKTQIINDRGIHICKSMLAWQQFGGGETPESTGVKGDKLVGKYYVEFDKHLKVQANAVISEWNSGDFSNATDKQKEDYLKFETTKAGKDEKGIKALDSKILELAKNATVIMAGAKEMLLKWEAKDPEVYALWEKMNAWVYKGFESTYKAMGVNFDKLYYESTTFLTGKDLVDAGLEKGIFFKKEDGSVWIDLTEDGLDEKLVLRADGTAVYMTQDMGTANLRYEDFPKLNGMIYTVGNEQDYHFKVLFLILKKMGYSWAEKCFHLSYGMVDLPSGKMKSREGTVVDADDLMADVVQKAKEMTQERGHIEGMSEEEKENLYNMIGMGGLKYYLLKVDPKKRMLFNPEESVDLNGNTGPFIQYAHARISSLLRKGGDLTLIDSKVDLHASEKELIKHLTEYPQLIQEAGKNHSPALIANFTYELVKMYNSFYQSVSIFREEDTAKVNLRLQLSKTVAGIIKSSMSLLGINVPERM